MTKGRYTVVCWLTDPKSLQRSPWKSQDWSNSSSVVCENGIFNQEGIKHKKTEVNVSIETELKLRVKQVTYE